MQMALFFYSLSKEFRTKAMPRVGEPGSKKENKEDEKESKRSICIRKFYRFEQEVCFLFSYCFLKAHYLNFTNFTKLS